MGTTTMKKGSGLGFPLSILGAGEESRTLDLNLGKVALYQLSYARIAERDAIIDDEKNVSSV